MASTSKTSAELLADFVYETDYDDLPEEAIKMSREMVLDQLGVELACSVLEWNKKVLKYVEDLAVASDQSTIPVFPTKDQAIDYAQRACFRSGEVRIFDSRGNIERVIPFDDTNRKL